MPAMRMTVEMPRTTLVFQTQWMCLDRDYSQSKTKAVLQGMEPALQKDQENFIFRGWSVHCGHGLQCLESLKFSLP